MGEEVRRQVGIEIYGRLVDTHYDNSIASLSPLDCMVSLVSTRTALYFMSEYDWAGLDAVEDHDNVYDKLKCCDCGEVEPAGGRRIQDLQQQRALCSRRSAIF